MADERGGEDCGESVAEVDGIRVGLGAVEPAGDQVVVRLVAEQGERTSRLEAEHAAVFGLWAETAMTARRAGRRPEGPPHQPGTCLASLTIELADDAGTPYELRLSWSAGTGTEWEAGWEFEPAPPPAATRLSIAVIAPDGSATTTQAPLT